MDLLIVRHGRPVRDERGTHEGPADPGLSTVGHEQAQIVADVLAGEDIDHIVSSSMARAHETAMPLALKLGYEIELSDDLRESDHNSSAYVPVEEISSESSIAVAYRQDPMQAIFEGDYEGFRDRVMRGFDSIIEGQAGKTVAVFCHGMVTAVFIQVIMGMPEPLGIRPDYTGITRIQASAKGHRTLRSVNETAHVRHLIERSTW
jgi:2,3-bisphosphoglycerate-dependent phosphoglycerate mutase